MGLEASDPTIAELLKPLGYVTGKFGTNHLRALNKTLPTVHGVGDFFGKPHHHHAPAEPEHEEVP